MEQSIASPAQIIGRVNECMRRLLEAGLTFDDLQKPINDPAMRQRVVDYWRNGGQEPSLLKPITTLLVPALSDFDASIAFGPESKIKIWVLGDNFRAHFLRKKEKAIGEARFQISELNRDSVDALIIEALGGQGKIEAFLAQFAWALEQQPNGEGYDPSQGRYLCADGRVNIAYIFDDEGVQWAVGADWRAGRGWGLGAWSVASPRAWHAGGLLFSQFQDPLAP